MLNETMHCYLLLPLAPMLLELDDSCHLQIPQNAFMLDFVFSDVESGDGTYDNQGGKDYHLPVEGSKASTHSECSALLPAKLSRASACRIVVNIFIAASCFSCLQSHGLLQAPACCI